MLLVFLQLGQGIDFVYVPVDPQPDEALGAQFIDQIHLLAFAPHHQWRKYHQPGIRWQPQYMIDHLGDALNSQGDAMIGTLRVAHAREKQAQVIMYFGNSAYSRARVMRSRLLLYGDGRR